MVHPIIMCFFVDCLGTRDWSNNNFTHRAQVHQIKMHLKLLDCLERRYLRLSCIEVGVSVFVT